MSNRVCCLYRVSTARQVDHDEQNQADIPMQRKACQLFAAQKGWSIVREEQETGVSGFKVSAHDRDKLQLIKECAERGDFDILLVFMFDRIGRRAEETPFVVEWFVTHGVQVWSVNEGEQRFDCHTDRLTNYIRFWQADGESRKTSVRTKTALGQMVQEGRFRGGITPYGYRLVPSGIYNKRRHEVFKLEIHEDEARVVRMMFDLCIRSGYGRFKIGNILSQQGILSREGKNWHEATVGHILHNVLYTGVLKSGDTLSESFPELQIVDTADFQLAQRLMHERSKACNALRTMPRNVRGQSLLSGNIFCGHCGGRLTLTSNTNTVTNASGEKIRHQRIRYVCYNKTRKRTECDGQTGYTMHILDELVTEVLHNVFDKLQTVSEDELVERTHRNAAVSLEERLDAAKKELAKATNEYDTLKTEVLRALQGQSQFPTEVLSELTETARLAVLSADQRLDAVTAAYNDNNSRTAVVRKDYQRLMAWSEIFDSSPPEVRKMIAGYIIRRVEVRSGYGLTFTFNLSFSQFELGLDG